MPPNSPQRRFTLLDAMIVLVAVAGVLMFERLYFEGAPEANAWFEVMPGYGMPITPRNGGWSAGNMMWYAPRWVLPMLPVAAVGSVYVLMSRLRPPRPRRWRLGTQPGFLASVSGTMAIGLAVVQTAMWVVLEEGMEFEPWEPREYAVLGMMFCDNLVEFAPGYALFGIITTWLVMACCGRLKAEASWVDRTGRAVGVLWLLLALVVWFLPVQSRLQSRARGAAVVAPAPLYTTPR